MSHTLSESADPEQKDYSAEAQGKAEDRPNRESIKSGLQKKTQPQKDGDSFSPKSYRLLSEGPSIYGDSMTKTDKSEMFTAAGDKLESDSASLSSEKTEKAYVSEDHSDERLSSRSSYTNFRRFRFGRDRQNEDKLLEERHCAPGNPFRQDDAASASALASSSDVPDKNSPGKHDLDKTETGVRADLIDKNTKDRREAGSDMGDAAAKLSSKENITDTGGEALHAPPTLSTQGHKSYKTASPSLTSQSREGGASPSLGDPNEKRYTQILELLGRLEERLRRNESDREDTERDVEELRRSISGIENKYLQTDRQYLDLEGKLTRIDAIEYALQTHNAQDFEEFNAQIAQMRDVIEKFGAKSVKSEETYQKISQNLGELQKTAKTRDEKNEEQIKELKEQQEKAEKTLQRRQEEMRAGIKRQHADLEDIIQRRQLQLEERLNERHSEISQSQTAQEAILSALQDNNRLLEERLELTQSEQVRIIDKLDDALAQQARLNRRLDKADQDKLRLLRKIDYLSELIDHHNQALQSKAMVLLTDRNVAEKSNRPYVHPALNMREFIRKEHRKEIETNISEEDFDDDGTEDETPVNLRLEERRALTLRHLAHTPVEDKEEPQEKKEDEGEGEGEHKAGKGTQPVSCDSEEERTTDETRLKHVSSFAQPLTDNGTDRVYDLSHSSLRNSENIPAQDESAPDRHHNQPQESGASEDPAQHQVSPAQKEKNPGAEIESQAKKETRGQYIAAICRSRHNRVYIALSVLVLIVIAGVTVIAALSPSLENYDNSESNSLESMSYSSEYEPPKGIRTVEESKPGRTASDFSAEKPAIASQTADVVTEQRPAASTAEADGKNISSSSASENGLYLGGNRLRADETQINPSSLTDTPAAVAPGSRDDGADRGQNYDHDFHSQGKLHLTESELAELSDTLSRIEPSASAALATTPPGKDLFSATAGQRIVNPLTDGEIAESVRAINSQSATFVKKQQQGNLRGRIEPDESLPPIVQKIEEKALQGIAEAQHDLAAIYTAGHAGTEQNFERAAFWFREAATGNIANARYNLGVLNHQGLGIETDLKEAIQWYKAAALLDHPEAQYNLGIAYIEGIGTEYRPALASYYFMQAALQGISEAAYNLGLIYENGLIGSAAPSAALYWYNMAAEQGNTDAGQAYEGLKTRLSLNEDEIADIIQGMHSLFSATFGGKGGSQYSSASGYRSSSPQQPQIELAAYTRGNKMPKTPAQERRAGNLLVSIQLRLMEKGLYPGPADGAYGPKTEDAIRAYQKQHKLNVTGLPSRDLLNHITARTP